MPSDVQISVGVDSSAVSTGLASIQNAVNKTGNEIKGMLAGWFSFGAAIAAFQNILAKAEQIHDTAARFGIDAEQLQRLGFAAKQDGVELDTLARAINKAVLSQQEAITQGGRMQAAFNSLKISVTELIGLNPEQVMLRLADGVAQASDKTEAYAAIAQILGSRFGTELIPMLQKGSGAILDLASKFHALTTQEVNELDALKDEEDKYLAHLQTILGEAVVGWGRFFSQVKVHFTNFKDWLNGTLTEESAQKNWQNYWESIMPKALSQGTAKGLIVQPPGIAPGGGATPGPAGGTAPSPGIGVTPTGPPGSVAAQQERNRLAALTDEERLLDLQNQRIAAEQELASIGDDTLLAYEKREALQAKIAQLDGQIIPLENQVADAAARQAAADKQALDTIDEKIAKSEHEAAIMQLIAAGREDEARILEIVFDYEEKITKAINDANEARARGNELIAKENEKLAEQLKTEEQIAVQQATQAALRKGNTVTSAIQPGTLGGLPLTSQGEINPNVSTAFTRGAFPSDTAYQNYLARVQLQNLTGINTIGFIERAQIAARQAAFNKEQQAAAKAEADKSRQDQIRYFQNIVAGHPEYNVSNPFTQFLGGTNPYAPMNMMAPPPNTQTAIGQTQIGLSQQMVSLLQMISRSLTPRPGGI